MYGDNGDDTMSGHYDSNYMDGGSGNDYVYGGHGGDQMWGKNPQFLRLLLVLYTGTTSSALVLIVLMVEEGSTKATVGQN
jgi:Ca2+-binding RTX toxin-like protein